MNDVDLEISSRLTQDKLLDLFDKVRQQTIALIEPLEKEDMVVQPMESASPSKWHLAHTSWFFETFVLAKYQEDFESLHPQYAYLFNSYYLQTGVPFTRSKRGVITRPTVDQVFEYRSYVNDQMRTFINSCTEEVWKDAAPVVEIGIHHEQQHQELIITDTKYLLAQNPLLPVYKPIDQQRSGSKSSLNWIAFEEGIAEIGSNGDTFTYDNEHPRHRSYIHAFELSDRLITNAEYLEFMEAGGYEDSSLWLDEGWAAVQQNNWKAPLYWFKRDENWMEFTLAGAERLNPYVPVCHISYFEADAFARWKGCRLPTEQEWEYACHDKQLTGNFVESGLIHPMSSNQQQGGLKQMFGDLWEWTSSSYAPYPGYAPLPGALGEYNGKFMANQYVLRGGSCATSKTHIRKTYRNFFHTDARWQFSGIRLAR